MKKPQINFRNVDGILLLDKPVGITSNRSLQTVKTLYKAKKAGHTGSLDPLASGLLPICFGQATKFSQFLLDADKSYRVTAKLGVVTASGDAEGEILSSVEVTVTKAEVMHVLPQFYGKINQIPSMFSALKHQGQPLYKLARQGITIERAPREVEIFKLDLLDFHDDFLELEIHCSKGTYVRTLIEDIGQALKCGAHVTSLRRLSVASYDITHAISLPKLEALAASGNMDELDLALLPINSMLFNWPAVNVSEAAAYYLRQGSPVIVPQSPSQGFVALAINNGRFLGVGKILSDGKIAPVKLVQ